MSQLKKLRDMVNAAEEFLCGDTANCGLEDPQAGNTDESAGDATTEDPETEPEKVLVPCIYVLEDGLAIALLDAEGQVQDTLTTTTHSLEDSEVQEFLAQAETHLALIGAQPSVPLRIFVPVVDAARYQCALRAMSGRCRNWEPLYPTVYLFTLANDLFLPAGPLPDSGEEANGGSGL